MSTYTVAEAKNRLSELINRALKGEGVVITRHGQPVVELRPTDHVVLQSRMTEADIERLRARRARLRMAPGDAVLEVRRMREEGEG